MKLREKPRQKILVKSRRTDIRIDLMGTRRGKEGGKRDGGKKRGREERRR